MATLLQLSLCVVTLIQLTSSQSTYDVISHDNDVNSCGGSEQVLSQLMTAVSQIQKTVSQMQTTVSQTQMAITQLQRDVAELKSFNQENATSQIQKMKSCTQSQTIDGMPITKI